MDRVPLTVSPMHVPPGATDPKHVEHAVADAPVIAAGLAQRPCPRGSFGLVSSNSASDKLLAIHDCSSKDSRETERADSAIPFTNKGMDQYTEFPESPPCKMLVHLRRLR